MYKKIASLAAVLALASTVAAQAQGNAVSSIQADLPVASTCSISASTNFNFAPIPAGPVTSTETATGGLTYACAGSTTAVTGLTLADATGGGAAFTLTNGTATIPFTITGTSTGTTPLTATTGIFLDNVQNTAETNTSDTITFTAALAPTTSTADAVSGTYTDTITATLAFT